MIKILYSSLLKKIFSNIFLITFFGYLIYKLNLDPHVFCSEPNSELTKSTKSIVFNNQHNRGTMNNIADSKDVSIENNGENSGKKDLNPITATADELIDNMTESQRASFDNNLNKGLSKIGFFDFIDRLRENLGTNDAFTSRLVSNDGATTNIEDTIAVENILTEEDNSKYNLRSKKGSSSKLSKSLLFLFFTINPLNNSTNSNIINKLKTIIQKIYNIPVLPNYFKLNKKFSILLILGLISILLLRLSIIYTMNIYVQHIIIIFSVLYLNYLVMYIITRVLFNFVIPKYLLSEYRLNKISITEIILYIIKNILLILLTIYICYISIYKLKLYFNNYNFDIKYITNYALYIIMVDILLLFYNK